MVDKAKMQKVFDKVAKHLLTQRCKSAVKGDCRYRGPNGLRCAIGALIPNKLYSADLEGRNARYLPAPIIKHIGAPKDFLVDLQRVHDDCHPNAWRRDLRYVAARYGLSPAAAE